MRLDHLLSMETVRKAQKCRAPGNNQAQRDLWRIEIEKKRIRYSQRIVQKKEFRISKSWNSLFDFQSPAKTIKYPLGV